MAAKPIQLDTDCNGDAQFNGARLSVDEFLSLPDDGHKYEMMNGVVVLSPRPTPMHQRAAREVLLQLGNYLKQNPVGEVFHEIDVHLGQRGESNDLVYAPDLIFVRNELIATMHDKITGAPDLVVEVVSRGSRRMDTITKREDYEHFGVGEYWIVDPQRKTVAFLRLKDGKFTDIEPVADTFASDAVPGFSLDLAAVRETFKPW